MQGVIKRVAFLISRNAQVELVWLFVEAIWTLNGGMEEQVALTANIIQYFTCFSLCSKGFTHFTYFHSILMKQSMSGKYILWTKHWTDFLCVILSIILITVLMAIGLLFSFFKWWNWGTEIVSYLHIGICQVRLEPGLCKDNKIPNLSFFITTTPTVCMHIFLLIHF